MIGKTLGVYRIIEAIGMDTWLFKAYDQNMDRHVILKLLPEHLTHNQAARERFWLDTKAIARLEHIHILPTLNYGEQDMYLYSVMRYIDTGTLADRARQAPLPLAEVNRLLEQVASALDYLHANKVIHRDVRPANIALDSYGNTYLTGFGLAYIAGIAPENNQGIATGTTGYMSPEAIIGAEQALLPTTDQYSLGLILYELVTGQTAHPAENVTELVKQRLQGDVVPPRKLRRELPEAAERVMLKSLSRQPEDRYPTCGAMAAAFTQGLNENYRTNIFISYRRSDSAMAAGRLYDLLSDIFGEERLFMDIDTIEPGEDFVDAIENTLNSCAAVIVMIARQWLHVADEQGRRRLDNPNDFVRLEIATALKRNIRVIPALVEDAAMPYAGDLPDDLAKLARQNALNLSAKYFRRDANKLVEVLEKLLPSLDDD
jgi:serine/threonine protein kinase